MTLKQATIAVVLRINQFSISGSDTSDNMNKKRYISYYILIQMIGNNKVV
ncbi:hypothetical protein [Virgibacillus salexigens]|uniref:Uncharacterized protein n=1 Tax=Virgibacillus kapii TaxID=1638645 RepID=A0ABQ2E0D9_9BACI|nr:hypothetical protein [Virgibacillus kapii]GGJ77582.1 hypothetical protein GCM10007111_43950 [Virgibacillus kapii]